MRGDNGEGGVKEDEGRGGGGGSRRGNMKEGMREGEVDSAPK